MMLEEFLTALHETTREQRTKWVVGGNSQLLVRTHTPDGVLCCPLTFLASMRGWVAVPMDGLLENARTAAAWLALSRLDAWKIIDAADGWGLTDGTQEAYDLAHAVRQACGIAEGETE